MPLTAILIKFAICLGILVAAVTILVLIGYVSGKAGACRVRVLMFSSIEEANRAAIIAGCECQESWLVTKPQYVPEIRRYFVVVEELTGERAGTLRWPDQARSRGS